MSNIKLVSVNEVGKSSSEFPLIGTYALATCFGILLYNEEEQKAIVAHTSSDWHNIISKIINMINSDKVSIYKYLIIPGFYSKEEEFQPILNEMNNYFNKLSFNNTYFIPFEIDWRDCIVFNETYLTHEFIFDTRTGKFINYSYEKNFDNTLS